MRITANTVTLLRLVFLPIPCSLMFGGPWHKALALVLFVAMGLTDYLDGYLARKQGPTTLGALMDPMADKIFVTTMFVPLVRLDVVPLWMVLLLLVREYAVTELRSIHGSRGVQFRTSELAKYKTTIQMIGGSVIILNDIFRDNWVVLIPLSGFFLFTLALAYRIHRKRGRLGPRIITLVILVGWALAMRCAFAYTITNWAIMALVVGATLVSGIQYAVRTWMHLGDHRRRSFGIAEWGSFVGVSFFFPAIYLSTLQAQTVATWVIIAIFSVEFITGGLNNLLTTARGFHDYIPPIFKMLLLNGAGALGLLLILLPLSRRTELPNVVLVLGLVASVIFCVTRFSAHRHDLLGSAAVSSR
jgi:cardiolipin synthase (CMP-forming)